MSGSDPRDRLDEDQARHVLRAALLTVLSDRSADAGEAVSIANILRDFSELRIVTDLTAVGREMRAEYDEVGLAVCARRIAAGLHDRNAKELAFICCARVMQADGETDLEEAELLSLFQELFELDGEDVKRLIAASRHRG